jgi:hypothetical protein
MQHLDFGLPDHHYGWIFDPRCPVAAERSSSISATAAPPTASSVGDPILRQRYFDGCERLRGFPVSDRRRD